MIAALSCEQIESIVEAAVRALDSRLAAGLIDEFEYHRQMTEADQWRETSYARLRPRIAE